MENEDKLKLKGIIETELEKLENKISEIREFTEPVSPDCAIGRVSRMDAINNRTVFEASLRNIKNRKVLLQQALKKINNDDFGICLKCHQSIPFERLMIRPEIKQCANCIKR